MRALGLSILFGLLVAVPTLGAEGDDVTPETFAAIAAKNRASFVDVDVTLRYDKGEAPVSSSSRGFSNLVQYVRDERPYRVPGFLVGPKTVVLDDPMIHPRFVEKIEVVQGDARTAAAPGAWFTRGGVMSLDLLDPLPDAKPLEFHPELEGPYFSVTYSADSPERWVGVHPVGPGPIWSGKDGRVFRSSNSLIVDREGRPVGLPLVNRLPLDGSWKGSPLDRPTVSASDMALRLADLEESLGDAVVRVQIDLRSPRQDSGGSSMRFFGGSEDGGETRMDVPGLRLPEGRLLVLAALGPKTTARLERITVHLATGDPVDAEFDGSLKHWGAFLAKLPPDRPGALAVDEAGALAHEEELLLTAQVLIQGETRICRTQPGKYGNVTVGWREQIHPALSAEDVYLFDREGRLVAFPLARRESQSNRYYSHGSSMFAAANLAAVFADRKEHIDPSNVPLTEEEENRVAWLGVILQPLNQELARANDVSELTRDGATGALVSYVYEGSPAAEAGIEPGAILIRLHSPDRPQPLEVAASGMDSLPFDIPDIPGLRERFLQETGATPWPAVDNAFTRMLTSLGFGSTYTAEYVQGGKLQKKEFTVVASPPHYHTVPRWKSDVLGMTVRDLSFEVRRYYQLEKDEPGVIVSKIEPGERAAVAGITPFEIVSQVDDKPVTSVADFEALVKAPGEHRLSVRLKTQTRIVKITVPE